MAASFSVVFNATTLKFELTDTSTGITLTNSVGNFTISAPNGQIYSNSDISFETATAQTGSTSSTIKLASGANASNNFYQDLFVQITSGTGAGQAKQVLNYNGSTKVATIVGTWSTVPDNTSVYRFCFGDIFLGADLAMQREATIPSVNGVIVNGSYTFDYVLTDTDTSNVYTASLSYDLNFTIPTIQLSAVVDCISPLLTANDITDYAVNGILPNAPMPRTHTLAAAPNIDPVVVTGSAATLTKGNFYAPTTYTQTVVSTPTWDFGNGITFTAQIEGVQQIATACDNWICGIFCCNINLFNNYNDNRSIDTTAANAWFVKWSKAQLITSLIAQAYQCGQSSVVNDLITAYRSITGCTDLCNCSPEPELVQGLGLNTNIYTLNEGDSYIDVVTQVSGNTTNWTVSLSQSALALLQAQPDISGLVNITVTNPSDGVYTITGATLTAGSGIGITPTSSDGVIVDYKPRLTNLLDSQFSDAATTGTTSQTLKTYTLPAALLGSNATRLRFKSLFAVNQDTTNKTVSLVINSTTIFSQVIANQAAIAFVSFDYELYREDATTLKVLVNSVKAVDAIGGVVYGYNDIVAPPITVNNLGTLTNTLKAVGDGSAVGDIINKDFSIEYLGK